MYLGSHYFMRPVFQGFKQGGEPAVRFLAKDKRSIWNTLKKKNISHKSRPLHLLYLLKFNSVIPISSGNGDVWRQIGASWAWGRKKPILGWLTVITEQENNIIISPWLIEKPKIVGVVKGGGEVFHEAPWKFQRGPWEEDWWPSCEL